jgi:hypothetical protein
MTLKRIISKYFRCWEETILLTKRPVLLLPFIVLALVEVSVLVSIVWFIHPPFSFFMPGLVKMIAGEQVLHYPSHLVLLPGLYQLILAPIMVVFGFALLGWGVFMIMDHYRGSLHGARFYLETVAWNMPGFSLIGLLFMGLVVGAPLGLSHAAGSLDPGILRSIVGELSGVWGFVWEVFLIYALVFMRLYPESAGKAIAKGFGFAKRRFIVTALVVATVALIHKPFEYLISSATAVAIKFKPELLVSVIVFDIIAEVITNYFLFVSISYLAATSLWKRR